ncbi:MAG: extracellular solute-binding protein [bacterium]
MHRAPRLQTRRTFVETLARGVGVGVPAVGALPWLLASSGCTGRSGQVVAYTSVDDVLAREVIDACRRATGVDVVAVFDTEATKTTGLENRVRAEANRPRADIFWSSEAFACARLAADGLLGPLPADLLASWPTRHRDPKGRWIAFSGRARVMAYRSDRDLRPPGTWGELATLDPAVRVAIADPRFGTTRGHIAALAAVWSAARSRENARAGETQREPRGMTPSIELWADGLRERRVRVLPGGNAATVEAVAAGEVDLGLTDTDDVLAAQARGLPVAFTLPRTLSADVTGGGTMIVPNTIGLVSGRPVRAEVETVLRWLVSADSERIICASPSRNIPLGPTAAEIAASCAAAFAENDPLAFDLDAVARGADELAWQVQKRLLGIG